jgi:transcriptional activator of cad operon
MERSATAVLRIGAWRVDPASGEISRDGKIARVEVRTMRVLLCLAEHAGEVVSIDELLNQVWPDVSVSPDSVYQAVTSLRRLLGDDPKQPTYIATVPRLGYRMVAAVSPWPDQPSPGQSSPNQAREDQSAAQANSSHGHENPTSDASTPGRRRRLGFTWAALAALCLVLVAAFWFHGKIVNNHRSDATSPPQNSIAVLPFLDLTEGMKNEEFADGITEELIDRLSKIPSLRVPAPTSSFYYKGKQIPIADIARTLGVAYVLDGSVRKSGTWVRVDARLVRADHGYVIWSESYDQPMSDILTIQDDIAGKVTKALKASIAAGSGHGGSQW